MIKTRGCTKGSRKPKLFETRIILRTPGKLYHIRNHSFPFARTVPRHFYTFHYILPITSGMSFEKSFENGDTLMPALLTTSSMPPSRVDTPGSDASVHRVKNVPGYTTPVFAGKQAQRAKVQETVLAKGFIPRELVKNEVVWFYDNLGIDDTYFRNESIEVISDHIIALFGAKVCPPIAVQEGVTGLTCIRSSLIPNTTHPSSLFSSKRSQRPATRAGMQRVHSSYIRAPLALALLRDQALPVRDSKRRKRCHMPTVTDPGNVGSTSCISIVPFRHRPTGSKPIGLQERYLLAAPNSSGVILSPDVLSPQRRPSRREPMAVPIYVPYPT